MVLDEINHFNWPSILARHKYGPDVFDPGRGIWWDVTTPGQWERHVLKYSGTHGEGIPLFHTRN